MKAWQKFLRDTLVGGIVFLLPFLLIGLLVEQALDIARRLMAPVTGRALAGDLGLIAQTLASIAGLLLLAFLAGVFIRTPPGQRLFLWVETSLLGALPQFMTARRLVERIGDEEIDVKVVLVPADGGLALGFTFAEEVDGWLPVFLPGAPDWQSGSILFVDRKTLLWPSLDFDSATRLLSRLGSDQGVLRAELRRLSLRPRTAAPPPA